MGPSFGDGRCCSRQYRSQVVPRSPSDTSSSSNLPLSLSTSLYIYLPLSERSIAMCTFWRLMQAPTRTRPLVLTPYATWRPHLAIVDCYPPGVLACYTLLVRAYTPRYSCSGLLPLGSCCEACFSLCSRWSRQRQTQWKPFTGLTPSTSFSSGQHHHFLLPSSIYGILRYLIILINIFSFLFFQLYPLLFSLLQCQDCRIDVCSPTFLTPLARFCCSDHFV